MSEQIELSSFDLRYEAFRIISRRAERALLVSILEQGIREPLQGVDGAEGHILLNGFKRYRCAKKLGLGMVPYEVLGNDEAMGIVKLLRLSNTKNLTLLEQAKFVDQLIGVHKLTVSEIAEQVDKSKAWVSVRAGIINEMSAPVRGKIFSGTFPVYSYMYTLRRFMRLNAIKKEEVESFVSAVSGKGLSTRDIDRLAQGYFRGPDEFREQIREGNVTWALSRLKEGSHCPATGGVSGLEQAMLRDLEITQKYMYRLISKSRDDRYKSNAFFVQANLLAGAILKNTAVFSKAMEDFHDRSGQAQSHLPPA